MVTLPDLAAAPVPLLEPLHKLPFHGLGLFEPETEGAGQQAYV